METQHSELSDKGELLGFPTWRDCFLHCCTLWTADGDYPSLDAAVKGSRDLEATVLGNLREHPDAFDYDVDQQIFQAFAWKKWRFASPEHAARRREEAISGFLSRNERAARIPLPSRHIVERMRTILDRWLPFVGVMPGKFGPGAVAECYSHARRWEVCEPFLNGAHTPSKDEVVCSRWLPDPRSPLLERNAARLCAVPKQWDKDRLITVEPCMRSFLQQSCRSTLYASIHAGPLRGSAMDVYADGQSIQRKLALEGSVTGKLATIDLSEASDNITAELVFSVMPSWVTTFLEYCRSPFFVWDGRTTSANIYAGMGNATTFVVESLIFAAYVAAVSWQHGLKAKRPSVFGDDIICESRVVPYLLEHNDQFFRINREKSFFGEFPGLRESCGIYAFKGRDVTPLRIRGLADSDTGRQGLADIINANWNAQQGYKVRFAHELAGISVERKLVTNLPFHVDGGHACISVPGVQFTDMPRTRMNPRLFRREALVNTLRPVSVEVRSDRPWALAGALLGVLQSRPRLLHRDVVAFPLRGRFHTPRKRWCRILSDATPTSSCAPSA